MNPERWCELQNEQSELTEAEIALGWHWCWEFDGLLVGPGSYELHCCHCLEPDHPVYQTTPPMESLVINEGDL